MTDTTTVTLADFLLARIAEDEAGARAAFRDGLRYERGLVVGDVPDDGRWSTPDSSHYEERIEGIGITIYDEGGHNAEQARHVARWDPARVLAECEAKRRIVEWCSERERIYVGTTGHGDPDGARPEDFVPGRVAHLSDSVVLRYLALPYADQPGFREEWRP